MCDEDTVAENQVYLRNSDRLSRRQFNTLSAGAALSLILPSVANALDVKANDVEIRTPDGLADCLFVHPASGQHPGVIIWPDILGLRPAFRLMAKRLAESGYAVLLINPYYRQEKSPLVAEGASFQDESVREKILPLARSLSIETVNTDAHAFAAYLDQQTAVDSQRKMGTIGYCMGGPFTLRTAAALPERIGAAASFHGGRLVTDKADSPHLLIAQMKASFLIAIASNDDQREPETKKILRDAYNKASLAAEIEVYEGAMHGWCPPDSRVYHEKQAERAWTRLLVLFKSALA